MVSFQEYRSTQIPIDGCAASIFTCIYAVTDSNFAGGRIIPKYKPTNPRQTHMPRSRVKYAAEIRRQNNYKSTLEKALQDSISAHAVNQT